MKRILLLFIVAILIVTALPSCTGRASMYSASSFEYFDTVTELVGYTASRERFDEAWGRVKALLTEHHRSFDIYNTYDGTVNLAAINDTAGRSDRSFSVSAEIYELLMLGKNVYELTDGKVNIAMGGVLSLWHECRVGEKTALPDPTALEQAAEHCSIDSFTLTESEGGRYLLTVTDPYLKFDVGAIAKGYSAKKAAELLDSLRLEGEGFMLNLGGMVCPSGTKPQDEAWIAGVEYPSDSPKEDYLCRVKISDGALVTSAAHIRAFTVDGKSYGHIIDSETLFPSERFAAVTVHAYDPSLGDALSTALFCMSEKDGRALIEKLGGAEAMWVYHDMTLSRTDGFSKMLVK